MLGSDVCCDVYERGDCNCRQCVMQTGACVEYMNGVWH